MTDVFVEGVSRVIVDAVGPLLVMNELHQVGELKEQNQEYWAKEVGKAVLRYGGGANGELEEAVYKILEPMVDEILSNDELTHHFVEGQRQELYDNAHRQR